MSYTTQVPLLWPFVITGVSATLLGALVIYGDQLQARWPTFWRD